MNKKLFIVLLIVPTMLLAQDKSPTTTTNKKAKVDATSGETKKPDKKKKEQFKGYITGRVKNLADKKVLEFATVSLTDTKTKKLIEGTITDNKGRFLFENINVGDYQITISFIGFENKTIDITTTKKNPDSRLKNITISPSSEMLSEVTIKEEKAIYETRIDKIVYNAEHDLNESENDATDVLRKAPLLSVDLEGNVSLRGSKNIKFLVNGKASAFFSSDVATALQMIPADQIKTVEVITSPGAKYDGEGDAGIVNIITKKTIIDGYKATAKGMVGTKVNRTGLSLNLGKGRFGLSARAGIHGSWPGRIGEDTYTRSDWDSVDVNENPVNPNILTQNGTSENFYQGYRGNISAFYDINAYSTFNSSFQFGGRTMPTQNKNSTIYTPGTDSDSSYNSYYDLSKTDRTLNMEWTTDYTRQFSENEGRELSVAFQIGGDINDGETDIDENRNNTFNQNDEKVIEETFQLDYTHPFGKNKLEIGGKIINRDREIVYSEKENNLYVNAEIFDYNQMVTASYISSEFNLPFGLGLKTGVRYEYTNTAGDWRNKSEPSFEKSYSDILPNIVFSKSFSPMRSIKLSYNQRISRPSVKHINPNENRVDNRNFTKGNADLRPTVTQQLEFGVNSFGRVLQGSFQLYYKHSTDIIESFLEVEDENSVSTFKNIGESKQYGGSFFGSVRINKFSFRGSFNLYSYMAKDPSFFDNKWVAADNLLYSYHMGGNYDLGNNWKVETFGFFRSPTQTIQGATTSFSMMSFGVKKVFKNKRGSLGLRIIEPFNETKEFTSELNGEYFSQSTLKSIPFRSLGISFKYTIGKLNFKDASKKSNIKNDDIQQDNSGEF